MDRKTLVAVALCVAILVFYQPILRRLGLGQYLDRPRPAAVDTTRRGPGSAPPPAVTPQATAPAATAPGASAPPPAAPAYASLPIRTVTPELERAYRIETPLYDAVFSSRGARLLSVELKRFPSARGVTAMEHKRHTHRRGELVEPGERVVLAGGPLFGLDLGAGSTLQSLADVVYAVEESADAAGAVRTLVFTARDSSGLTLRQTYRVRPDDYALDYAVEIQGVPTSRRLTDYALTMRSWPLITESNLQSDERSIRSSSMLGTAVHKDHAQGLLKSPKNYDGSVQWAGVQSRYFVAAAAVEQGAARSVIERAERHTLTPEELATLPAGSKPDQEVAVNSLVMALPAADHPVHRFTLYFGPLEYFRLASLRLRLERAVDLGWTWMLPVSMALLRLLNWLFALLHNYGVAIIVLATLVRVVLHPLNMTSMKSQRAMMKLQPEMNRIKEKYKNDATAQNTAIMALYKENKVNPAGGCLPMLVQMPAFIALYNVLFNAIELRQAPFVGWMSDLSAPDMLMSVGGFPIRLLPLVMAGSGLLSQMLTPTDPSQKPTMYLMNVFMLVFFYNLPSGLVLYWTVMNLLTALQQWLVLRHDSPAPGGVVEVISPEVVGSRRKGAR